MAIGKILLPSLALALGIFASIYFVFWWWRHRRRDEAHARSLLFWAMGLFLMYWFQVPAILVGLGKTVTVTDFNLFFALTLPITFLALMLFYFGILQISKIDLGRNKKIFLFAWFVFAVAFFAYYFITEKGIINTYVLPLVGNILFYLPIRLLIIVAVIRSLFHSVIKNIYGILGVIGIVIESILGLMRNFFVIETVLDYPPSFWYLAMSGSKFFFVTQTLSIILLVFGFYFLHFAHHRLRYKNSSRRKIEI